MDVLRLFVPLQTIAISPVAKYIIEKNWKILLNYVFVKGMCLIVCFSFLWLILVEFLVFLEAAMEKGISKTNKKEEDEENGELKK